MKKCFDGGNCGEGGYCDKCLNTKPDFEGFMDEVLEHVFDGGGFDGVELQELASTFGILKTVEMQNPCGEACNCEALVGADSFPLTCYRKTY
ncbi:MAG: hypothetical protein COB36_10805 [Alphaproteobacteria bacterium]|nr:MAG: hypothetical protein COB36_10805 [Alphaproteobacteria bacterium]